MYRHSKLPFFMRMHGSVTPKMIVPLLFIACWATAITCIHKLVRSLAVDSVLLTILGFVVGLGISVRTSSAYERYAEGRKSWGQLAQTSRDLARHIWIHAGERHEEPEVGKADLLAKITALNLIGAFALALKHKLRFEPFANYEDLIHLIGNLSTFAQDAQDLAPPPQGRNKSMIKRVGEYLGLTFAESNPRKLLKDARARKKNLGNLPLEILSYLSSYMQSIIANKTYDNGPLQGMAMSNIASLNEILTQTERVLNTPLPIAYTIAISQITWAYVLLLPFQLVKPLDWVAIPGTFVGAYIILGIAAIGREIENPFGEDVNDLPLDDFCKEIASDLDIITSRPAPSHDEFITTAQNKLMHPLTSWEYSAWNAKSTDEIRQALMQKAITPRIANEPTLPMDPGSHPKV